MRYSLFPRSIVIHHLQEHFSSDLQTAIVFAYCRYTESCEGKSWQIIRSLVRLVSNCLVIKSRICITIKYRRFPRMISTVTGTCVGGIHQSRVAFSCGCNDSVDPHQVVDFDGIISTLDDFTEVLKQVFLFFLSTYLQLYQTPILNAAVFLDAGFPDCSLPMSAS
jgi:hypothetical protein